MAQLWAENLPTFPLAILLAELRCVAFPYAACRRHRHPWDISGAFPVPFVHGRTLVARLKHGQSTPRCTVCAFIEEAVLTGQVRDFNPLRTGQVEMSLLQPLGCCEHKEQGWAN